MKIAVYLDTDCNGNDLLDNAGNIIPAGWYLYEWLIGNPLYGPCPDEATVIKEGLEGDGI